MSLYQSYLERSSEDLTMECFSLMKDKQDLENKVESLEKRLEQQLFNNKHNLSIDQTVADRMIELKADLDYLSEAVLDCRLAVIRGDEIRKKWDLK
jgi:valyl-tRNA synthetase